MIFTFLNEDLARNGDADSIEGLNQEHQSNLIYFKPAVILR